MAMIERQIIPRSQDSFLQQHSGGERLNEYDRVALVRGDTVPLWEPQRGSRDRKRENPPEDGADLSLFIDYFDTNWGKEGLPKDWFNLKKKVGFSMNSQMALLENTDRGSVTEWSEKTIQDIKGFALEYLSTHLVYPCRYEKDPENPGRLINPQYGMADMVETVSEKERNGSVFDTLSKMKAFFLSDDTPDGSIAVMTSPKGPSGLTTDDGQPINYPDSYFFIMQKNGDVVTNFTIKTDFHLHECREALYRLTGIELSASAGIEEYVRAIARFRPGEENDIQSVSDVVRVLQTVRKDQGSDLAFKTTEWEEVYADLKQEDKLYNFNSDTNRLLEEFEAYCTSESRTESELRKALAATILRISKLLLSDQPNQIERRVLQDMEPLTYYRVIGPPRMNTYGAVLDEVARRPGCAGGGDSIYSPAAVAVDSITPRLGIIGDEDQYGSLTFRCPECYFRNTRKAGELLTRCQNEYCTRPERVAC